MRIDAHHHVWDLTVRDQPWTVGDPVLHRTFTAAELHPSLAWHGVDATVVVQTVCVPEETPELLALAATDRFVRGVVGWVDLTAPDVAERLAALRAGPGGGALVGVRHQVQEEPDPRWLCRDDVRRGLAAVGAAGLVYDLVVTAEQLPAVVETVRALPHVRFVLDHAGKPPVASGAREPWATHVRALGRSGNVAAKLSGLVTEAGPGWTVDVLRPYAATVLDAFGPRRTMFGSDWPTCLPVASYDDVVAATAELLVGLDDADRADVLGGTAQRWYGIGEDAR